MKKAIRYSLWVCLLSWATVAVAYFGFGMNRMAKSYTVFAAAYMFFPLVAALLLKWRDGEKFNSTNLVSFKVRPSWFVAWILPVAMMFVCILINGLLPGVEWHYGADQVLAQAGDALPEEQREAVMQQLAKVPAAFMVLSSVFSALMAGVTINAVAAFGEEYGWRNYLVDALRGKGFWTASLFIGMVWGVWHFPIILMGHNYPNEPVWGVALMVVMCLLLGVVELYFVLKTKSVVVAAVMHGTFNAISGLVLLFVRGGNDFLNGMTGLAGFITMALAIGVIFLYDRCISKDDIMKKTLGESLGDEYGQG